MQESEKVFRMLFLICVLKKIDLVQWLGCYQICKLFCKWSDDAEEQNHSQSEKTWLQTFALVNPKILYFTRAIWPTHFTQKEGKNASLFN